MSQSSIVIRGPVAINSMPSVAWKNGGGTTRTLAVDPECAGLEDFTWRISLAEIHGSGSFSLFPGIDRTILLWSGDGVLLCSSAWPTLTLNQPWNSFSFRGEDEVSCELLGGATTDLNVMVRRGVTSATIHAHNVAVTLADPYKDVVVLCARGCVRVSIADHPALALKTGYVLRLSSVDRDITIRPEENAIFIYAAFQSSTIRGAG